jgi:hypothetical protein
MTPLYATWSRRGAVEQEIYKLGARLFTVADLKHAMQSNTLIAALDLDARTQAVRDSIRGLRAAQRIEVVKTSGRGGGYTYRCTLTTPREQTLAADKLVVHFGHELNRRTAVETEIWNAVNGRTPLPDVEQLRKWALKLGVPDCGCFTGGVK